MSVEKIIGSLKNKLLFFNIQVQLKREKKTLKLNKNKSKTKKKFKKIKEENIKFFFKEDKK